MCALGTFASSASPARELTRRLIYWLQTEPPQPDGGSGYPQLRLAAGALGTCDGLAGAPDIRESRRIRAEFTVAEQHIGVAARSGGPGAAGAALFADSAGIGSYRIDLHPSTAGRGYLDISPYPFQIPLGALVAEYFDIGQSRSLPWARRLRARRPARPARRPAPGL